MPGKLRRVWKVALAGALATVVAGPAAAQSPSKSQFATLLQPTTQSPPSAFAPTPGLLPVQAQIPVPSTPPPMTLQPTPPPATLAAPPKTQASPDTGMSSKPPAFTIPPGGTTPAAADPNAPAVSNDTNTFAGFPDPQDAFSRLLPGKFKDTKYKWYGFVRVDGIFDTKPIKSTDMFVNSSIPIPQGKGSNAVLTPRYSRLGFDTETPMEDHDWTIKTRIEMDFFNGNTSGLFGSFPIRLRFAWIDVGPFLVGQAASLFMDYDVFPNVLDYEGPPGMVLMRQPVLAYRANLADNLKLSVGVEQPYSDIQWLEAGGFVVNPGTGIIPQANVAKNIQNVPDVTANLRYTHDYGHLQVAGIVRKLAYQTAGEQSFHETGYGVNVTGTLHPWAALRGVPKDTEGADIWEKSRLLGQYATGRGINRYIQDINGLGLDAVANPLTGLRALTSTGWFVAYEQWWTDKLASNFIYGRASVDLTDTLLPLNTYKAADYAGANLIWLPVSRLGLGIEVLYGTRENRDGAKGKDVRIQTAVQYRF
jgi:DcaP outer membrane protein